MGIKNIWSLNVDELLVANQLKYHLNKKEYEVFFPLNAQMKDIDLAVLNLKNNKAATIQVKGSRTYDPTNAEIKRYGSGGAAWFRIHKDAIFKPQNKIDYFIFVLHSFEDGEIKKEIRISYLIIPYAKFIDVCNKKSSRKGGYYHFYIWLDESNKRAFEFRDDKDNVIPLSKYLNKWDIFN